MSSFKNLLSSDTFSTISPTWISAQPTHIFTQQHGRCLKLSKWFFEKLVLTVFLHTNFILRELFYKNDKLIKTGPQLVSHYPSMDEDFCPFLSLMPDVVADKVLTIDNSSTEHHLKNDPSV